MLGNKPLNIDACSDSKPLAIHKDSTDCTIASDNNVFRVALVGNPNVGKSSIYNRLTASNARVGNWHGVTVDSQSKTRYIGQSKVEFVDLPGVYSLDGFSKDENITLDYLNSHHIDIIVCVCSTMSMTKGLLLALQVLHMHSNVIVAINMSDMQGKHGAYTIDIANLQNILGVDCVLSNTSSRSGLDSLIVAIDSRLQTDSFSTNVDRVSSHYCGALANNSDGSGAIASGTVEQMRYDNVSEILSACTSKPKQVKGLGRIDKIILNRYLALPIFFALVSIIFAVVFGVFGATLGGAINSYITSNIYSLVYRAIINNIHYEWVTTFVCDCLIMGVFGIIQFLPSIAMLHAIMTALEDSGYISRIAFVTDELFARIGLSGRSVFVLLLGFGCSASALTTARTAENSVIQRKTVLLTPFVPCSARLPVFALIATSFFGAYSAIVVFAMYAISILVILILSSAMQLIRRTRTAKSISIMEMPRLRTPSIGRMVRSAASNSKDFVIRIGTIGIALNIIIWILSNFTATFAYVPIAGGVSMMNMIGRILEPIFVPLGFGNWRVIAALIGGIVAKEVVLTTISGLGGLTAVLGNNPITAFAFLLFVSLYTPCIATIGNISKELGRRYVVISLLVSNAIAYLVASIFVLLASLWSHSSISFAIAIFVVIIAIAMLLHMSSRVGLNMYKDRKN